MAQLRPVYVDFGLLFSIAILTTVIMQLSIFLIGTSTCEYMGLQAENTFCQIYFSVNFDDSLKMNNVSRSRRWCLLWRRDKTGPYGIGMRCMRDDSLLIFFRPKHHHEPAKRKPKIRAKKATPTHTTVTTTLKPKLKIPEVNLSEMRTALPLLELKAKSLTPRIWIKRNRQNVDLVMALSIYKLVDNEDQPIFKTLDSLFFNIPPTRQHRYLVLVFITEILDDAYMEKLISEMMIRYTIQIETGLMEIVVPRDNFYFAMFTQVSKKANGLSENKKMKKRHRYRKKQCMDLIFMMVMAYQRGKYYLQLSHNVLTRQGFLSNLHGSLDKHQSQKWSILDFSQTGIIGKVIHTYDLLEMATYLSRLDLNKPAVYHIETFLKSKTCEKEKIEKCEAGSISEQFIQTNDILFQYIKSNVNRHRESKDGKQEDPGIDPKAMWVSPSLKSKTIKDYVPCTSIGATRDILPFLSSGAMLLKASGSTPHERISIGFVPPLNIYKIRLATGLRGTASHNLGEDATVWSFTEKLKKFNHIGNFNSLGDFEVSLNRDLREVHALEIFLGSTYEDQDIFFREFTLTMNCRQSTHLSISSTADIKPTEAPSWYIPPPTHTMRREGHVLVSY